MIDGRPMDYADPADFPAAAFTQRQRRGTPATHHWVAGIFLLDDADHIALHALTTTPGVYTLPAGELSPRQHSWYRWRTKQAARQWLIRNPQPVDVRPVNLDSLDVHQESCLADNVDPRSQLPT
jgi:hypothetical protein